MKRGIKKLNIERIIAHKTNGLSLEIIIIITIIIIIISFFEKKKGERKQKQTWLGIIMHSSSNKYQYNT